MTRPEFVAMAESYRAQARDYEKSDQHALAKEYRDQADRMADPCTHEWVTESATPFSLHERCVRCQLIRPIEPPQ